jgi:probable HAF family extracellular repeat protein
VDSSPNGTNFRNHGFLYSGGSYTTLDYPSTFGNGTSAFGINDKGQIVGVDNTISALGNGFLYSGGSFTTLHDPSATGGTFAHGINDKGQIVGQYFTNGSTTHGFLATDPPTTSAAAPPAPLGQAPDAAANLARSNQLVAQLDQFMAAGFHTGQNDFGPTMPISPPLTGVQDQSFLSNPHH